MSELTQTVPPGAWTAVHGRAGVEVYQDTGQQQNLITGQDGAIISTGGCVWAVRVDPAPQAKDAEAVQGALHAAGIGDRGDCTGQPVVDHRQCPQCGDVFQSIARTPEGERRCPRGHVYRIKVGVWDKVV